MDVYDDYLELQWEYDSEVGIQKVAVNEGMIQCVSLVQCVDFAKKYYQEKMSEKG